ncbi:TonB-dependent receptor domain-containing protein [Pedobacter deserti]|uniref:TonB-dependent receptor domain-containing protein n=1 Tax=Pedobacter deserti TaxID=2817382 RepID=UPI00210DD6EC|nr:TonB-dependent receptor [Pedobacter sp. SYSU D00382]
MTNTLTKAVFTMVLLCVSALVALAQNVTIGGAVIDKATREPMPGVGITVKGTTSATATNSEGKFALSTSQKLPFTLVISYVGYNTIEQEVTAASTSLNFELESGVILGQEVVVSASRTPERILESPVSIERMGVAVLRELPAPSFYDALANLKGVETSAQSLTFRSINTRGFNSNGNIRFNQYVDGMDNQAPGLNFSVGNIIGLNDLDVDNVELLPGAASALYGAGGINGTMLMTSKNPFTYQGPSFQFKTGINHVNDDETGTQQYNQFDLRMAKAWNNKLAVKGTFSFLQAKDWQASNYSNFDRTSRTQKAGDRNSDPAYDGINVYGDETSQNMRAIVGQSIEPAVRQGILGASGGLFDPRAALNNVPAGSSYATYLTAINSFPIPAPLRSAVANQYLPFYFGLANPAVLPNQEVTRTGYNENTLVDYNTESMKASGALHYKFTPSIEGIAQINWGTGTSVYTGTDRYSLRNFSIGQYKLELKGEDFFVRGYTTQERSGDSYISSIVGAFINETYKRSEDWFPQYIGTYIGAKLNPAGLTDAQAHAAARAAADQGRLIPGTPAFEEARTRIANTTIVSTDRAAGVYGAKFDDRTNLYHYEGLYNFSNLLNNVVELQIGGSYRIFQLRSNGTIFDDRTNKIDIDEYGVFGQLSKKFFEDKFKLSLSGRYDKNQNFEGRLTPRISGVYTVAPNNNIRVSYQTGYRNPTTQNQYIDLTVGGGQLQLIGGLPSLLSKYDLYNNRPYTDASYRAFVASAIAGTPNESLLQAYQFDPRGVVPESVKAYEIGYKGLLGGRLLIDAYAYYNTYKNFITAVEVYQRRGQAFQKFGVPVNADGEVDTYGAALGIDYLIAKYNLSGNVSYNEIGDLPAGFLNDFNTPTIRYNVGLGNREIVKNVGFNVNYRWQDSFYWTSSFASGTVPAFGTADAQVNFKVPSVNSMIKIGGTNILNKYYFTSYGNPSVGALYYVGFTYNP